MTALKPLHWWFLDSQKCMDIFENNKFCYAHSYKFFYDWNMNIRTPPTLKVGITSLGRHRSRLLAGRWCTAVRRAICSPANSRALWSVINERHTSPALFMRRIPHRWLDFVLTSLIYGIPMSLLDISHCLKRCQAASSILCLFVLSQISILVLTFSFAKLNFLSDRFVYLTTYVVCVWFFENLTYLLSLLSEASSFSVVWYSRFTNSKLKKI